MVKKTDRQIRQEKEYFAWKAKKDSQKIDTPVKKKTIPVKPKVTRTEHIKIQRNKLYEETAQKNREKYPEIAELVDELRKHFGEGVKVVSVTPRPAINVNPHQAPTNSESEIKDETDEKQ